MNDKVNFGPEGGTYNAGTAFKMQRACFARYSFIPVAGRDGLDREAKRGRPGRPLEKYPRSRFGEIASKPYG